MADTIEGAERPKESSISECTISSGTEGVSTITTKLGIRESKLEGFKTSGDIRVGDTFKLTRMTDGSGVLKRIRGTASKTVLVSKEALYQDIEKGPDGFSQIAFLRLPGSHTYKVVGKNGESLGKIPLIVDAANLDILKRELDKVSGVFVTECSARSAIADLSCDISPQKSGKGIIELNSKSWYDVLGTVVSLGSIQKLLHGSREPSDIAETLAHSFNPSKQYPDTNMMLANKK